MKYRRAAVYMVKLEGHPEPVQMVSVERTGMCAGGGVMLIANRGDGEIDRIVDLLNAGSDVPMLRDVIAVVADEPNIDRARAIADQTLYPDLFSPEGKVSE